MLRVPSQLLHLKSVGKKPLPPLQMYSADKDDVMPSDEEKIQAIESHFKEIFKILNLDLSQTSFSESPQKIARMYVEKMFYGLNRDHFPKIKTYKTHLEKQLIVIESIPITSFCQHHFVPMLGHAKVGYIPRQKMIGFSRVHTIVDYLAKKPQVQEHLISEIGDTLANILGSFV